MDEPASSAVSPEDEAASLRALLESALDVLLVLDPTGRVLAASPATESHLGYPGPGLAGRDAFLLVHEEDGPALRRLLAGAPSSSPLRLRLRHHDGPWRALEARGRTLSFSGRPPRLVLSGYDVTERVEAEARAARLQAALFRISETASTVSGLAELYPALHRIVGELMDARNFFVALLDPDGEHLRFPYFVDEAEEAPTERLPASGTLSAYVMRTGSALLVRPDDFERLQEEGQVRQVGAASVDWLGVPLMRGDQAFGALVVQTHEGQARYREADRDVLTFVSRQIATAIDRQQATDSLRESARRFRLLFDGNPLATWVYHPDTLDMVNVNEAALRQYGYSRPEFLALRIQALYPPEDWEGVHRRVVALAPGATTLATVLRHRRKDGTVFPVELSGQELPLGPRRARVVVVRDLTERIKAEEQLRQNEEQFRALIENAADLITVVGRDGRIRYQSPSVERVGGYRPEEITGRDPGELIHPEDQAAARRFFEEACVRPGLTATLRVRFRRRDGAWRLLEGQGHNRLDQPGVQGVVFNLRDVTDRVRAEEALQQAQKLESLGVLAGGVAHDFNNLLGVVLGQNTLALRRMPKDTPGRSNVEKTIPVVERAVELAAKMLAYSGKGHFEVGPVDLGALCRDNRPLYEAALPKSIRLAVESEDGLPLVTADAGQMHQVVLNLVLNAAEAMAAKPGTVTLHTRPRLLTGEASDEVFSRHTGQPLPPGTYAGLEVVDEGEGMEAATVSRIFDPFFTTRFVGRGLGLAAVLGIVRGHRGGIAVESARGRGSRITVLIPAAAVPAGRADREGDPDTVLVVGAEEALREVVRDVLEANGYAVVTAADGVEGARLFAEDPGRYALVVLDLERPDPDDEKTLVRLRQVDPRVRVVLTSGFPGPPGRAVAREGIAFLAKPFTPSQLLDAVRRRLDRRPR